MAYNHDPYSDTGAHAAAMSAAHAAAGAGPAPFSRNRAPSNVSLTDTGYPLPSYHEFPPSQAPPPPAHGSSEGMHFLHQDPAQPGALMRSDTIRPADSISQYHYPMNDHEPSAAAAASEAATLPHGPDRIGRAPSTFTRAPSEAIAYSHRPGQASADSSSHYHGGHAYRDSLSGPYAAGAAGDTSFGHSHPGYSDGRDDRYRDHFDGNPAYHASSSNAALPLRGNAAGMGYADDEYDELKQYRDGDQERDRETGPILFSNHTKHVSGGAPGSYADASAYPDSDGPAAKLNNLRGFLSGKEGAPGSFGYPQGSLQDKIERRRRGIGRQRYAPVSWIFAAVYLIVFIIELVRSAQSTGAAIQTKPQIQPMIGPSVEFLISFGARFGPCMRELPSLPANTSTLPCLDQVNSESNLYQPNQLCTLADLCGLSNPNKPDQMWRLMSAMFLHAGVVHILFNLIAQCTICVQIEKLIGSPFYLVVYVLGGLTGNLLGANFGLIGIPSVGASGAIFSAIGVEIVDLCYNWRYEPRAKTHLAVSVITALFSFGLGLLPGLDQFCHLGGFAIGILGGLSFAPSVHPTKSHRNIVGVLRIAGAALAVAMIVGLAVNYVNATDPSQACTWCRKLSCLEVFQQCKNNGITTGTTTGSNN